MQSHKQLQKIINTIKSSDHEKIVESSLKSKKIDFFGYTVFLHYAAAYGRCRVAQLLINYSEIIETDDDIQIAIEDKCPIIDSRNGYNKITPLHSASRNGRVEMIQLLCNNGANVNLRDIEGKTALYIASEAGNTAVVRCLLHMPNIDPTITSNIHDYAPIHVAAEAGNPEIVQLLLEHTPNLINTTTDYGDTALHLACEYEKTDTAKIIIAAPGVNINITNQAKWRPLDHAHNQYNTDLIPLLLAKGAKTKKFK